jgi:hypothetical protein
LTDPRYLVPGDPSGGILPATQGNFRRA